MKKGIIQKISSLAVLSSALFLGACWENPSNVSVQGEPLYAAATQIDLKPIDDAYVRNGTYANTNYGNSGMLEARVSSTANNYRSTFLKFDLNSSSGSSTFKLRLYGKYSAKGNASISIYSISDNSWTESTLNFNNRPSSGSELVLASITGTSSAWREYDVTSHVSNQMQAGNKILSFMVVGQGSSGGTLIFNSSENASNKPVLRETPSSTINAPPTVATPAAAVISANKVYLNVLGADDAGEANLSYVWKAISIPAGAEVLYYSTTPANSEKNSQVNCSQPGTYTFEATISDIAGLSVKSTVVVNLVRAATYIIISPINVDVNANGTQQFNASVGDQWENPLTVTPIPNFTWKASAGTISATGLFTAGSYNGYSVIEAAAAGLTNAPSMGVGVATIINGLDPDYASGLKALWNFDEGTGTTTLDESGNNNTGTLMGTNGLPVWTYGYHSNAVQFDGVDDYVKLNSSTSLNLTGSMTISAFVKSNALGQAGRIISKQGVAGGNQRGWNLGFEADNKFYFGIASNATTMVQISSNSLSNLNYQHVAGVYNATDRTLKIYIDGILEKTLATGVPAAQYNSTNAVRIGMRPIGDLPFKGQMEVLRVYNRALTDQDVLALKEYDTY